MLIVLIVGVVLVALVARQVLRHGSRSRPRERIERLASLFAPLWSLLVSSYGLAVLRQQRPVPETLGTSPASAPAGDGALVGGDALAGALFLTVPVALSMLPWAATRRAQQRRVMLAAGALQTVIALAGALSVGLWYLPSGLAQMVVAIVFKDAPTQSEKVVHPRPP